MKNINSRSKDVMWLAYQLKNVMGSNVSFNRFGLDSPILTGVYTKDGTGGPYYGAKDIRFFIKYHKNEFLRIQIELGLKNNEDVICAMEELINALAIINQGESVIGYPIALYETDECLSAEYRFKDKEETILALQDGSIFDDGDLSNLKLIGTESQPKIKVLCKEITDSFNK